MLKLLRTLKVGLSFGFILGLNACGSDSKENEREEAPCAAANAIVAEPTYESLWTNVFEGRCGTCHGVEKTETQGGPDMRTRNVFHDGLFGKTIGNYPDWRQAQITLGECADIPLINPGTSSQSLLVAVFDAAAVPLTNCEVLPHKMPPQNVCISDGSLAALKKWIDNGASK